MPTSGWNGKFLSAGEGGYAGAINYGGIADALRRGYAGGSTDTGHSDGAPSTCRAVQGHHPRHYGKSATHSYFAGKLAPIQAATLGSCDAKDGVVDGVAEDPRRCHFDPASLACPAGTDGPSCLTPPQVTAVRKIMSGPHNPRTGQAIFPGYFTSAAGEAASWPLWVAGPPIAGASVQAFFGNAFFGRVVHEIPAPGVWDYSTFYFDGDMIAADAKNRVQLQRQPGPSLRLPPLQPARQARATSSGSSWCRGCCTVAAGPARIPSGSRCPRQRRSAIRRSTTS